MAVRRVGLEVRVAPHGNFGPDITSARRGAARFCEVAQILGLDPVCIITDATRPFQPYVGRGEALVALRVVLDGGEDPWLADHLRDCAVMAAVVGGEAAGRISRVSFGNVVRANVEAQGATLEALPPSGRKHWRAQNSRKAGRPTGGSEVGGRGSSWAYCRT